MNDEAGGKQRRARFQALCQSLRPDLLRFAFWLSRDRALAEDVVQESMLRAWKAQDSLLDESAAKPWLLTIIRREYARTFERKRFPTVDVDELIAKEEPLLAAAEEQDIRDVRSAMLKLPDEYREPLVLQVLMGYSTAEIARELDLSGCGGADTFIPRAPAVACGLRRRHEPGPAGMMEHAHYRTAILADPHSSDAELRAHREACTECRAVHRTAFEFRIAAGTSRARRASRPRPMCCRLRASAEMRRALLRGWLALAASVLLGAAMVGGVWLTLPQSSLAAAVVAHMAGEPEAWRRTDVAVPTPELDDVLKNSKLRLKPDAGIVSYASSCTFRGYKVPHLVVQTASGPVTVMVLVHEAVRHAHAIRRAGLSRNHRAGAGPRQHRRAHARSRHTERVKSSASPTRVHDSIVWTR